MPDAVILPFERGARRAQPCTPPFVCRWITDDPDRACIHVAGELDITTTPRLRSTLRQARTQAEVVVLDLRALTYMDACGAHAIIDASGRARRDGRRFIVLRGAPAVCRRLELAGGGDVELHDLDPASPPVQILLRLAQAESGA